MSEGRFDLKIWGARGSLPVAGPCFSQFGGNTISVEVRCGENVLLFDAGSGLPIAGRTLLDEGIRTFNLFFSHCHYDHILGLPFFLPLYVADASISFWSGHQGGGGTTKTMIADFLRRPYFPVGPEVFQACVSMHDFQPGAVLTPFDGVVIRTAMLSHPGGAVGYRVEYGGRALAMIFDTDHQPDALDPVVMELISGADLFLYDATFTDDEFETYRYFGHSTWQQGVRLALAAGAAKVGFVHHATFRTDEELAEIESAAQQQFAGAFCGRDMQVISL